jgi:hypothetical protein
MQAFEQNGGFVFACGSLIGEGFELPELCSIIWNIHLRHFTIFL